MLFLVLSAVPSSLLVRAAYHVGLYAFSFHCFVAFKKRKKGFPFLLVVSVLEVKYNFFTPAITLTAELIAVFHLTLSIGDSELHNLQLFAQGVYLGNTVDAILLKGFAVVQEGEVSFLITHSNGIEGIACLAVDTGSVLESVAILLAESCQRPRVNDVVLLAVVVLVVHSCNIF